MLTQNINSNLSVVESIDKTMTKSELLDQFEMFIGMSGYSIFKIVNTMHNPYELILKTPEGRLIYMIMYLKRITGSGWISKPWIKRVQVNNIKIVSPMNVVETTDSQYVIIFGYYNYDNNPLLIAWDGYEYIHHTTLRSCYVSINSMIKGYRMGLYYCLDSSKKVWIITPHFFPIFLDHYKHNVNEAKDK